MWDMHALTSISVVAAPKGGPSLCSAAGQANIRPAGFVFVNSVACGDRLLHTSRCPLTANY